MSVCLSICLSVMSLPVTDCSLASRQAIMLAVMKKLTYDDEYNFDNEVSKCVCTCVTVYLFQCITLCVQLCVFEGEDEAMFVEYRKQLKMLLDRLAQVSPDLLLGAVGRVFTATMQ